MGLFSSLFGGSKTKIESVDTLTPAQKGLADNILPELQAPAPSYSGPVSTKASGAETLSLRALEQLALNYANNQGAANDAASQALLDILSQGATDFQEYYANTVYNPAIREFTRDIIPAIDNEFADQYFSGERRQARLDAGSDLERNLLESRSDLAFKTREADRSAKIQAATALPGIGSAEIADFNAILTGATSADSLAQGRLDKEYSKFLDELEIKDARTKNILTYLGIPMKENIAKTKSSKGILSGLADVASAYTGFKGV